MLEWKMFTVTFSLGDSPFCRGGGIYRDLLSKVIKPFPKEFRCLQEPRKLGVGIGCPTVDVGI